jgi:hypothetical protein
MKITNKHGLPAPLVKAVSLTRHESDDDPNAIRVSQVIMPIQLRALLKRHENEIEEDAADRIFALLGTLLHDRLENSAKDLADCTTEEALSMEILGWKVTGHYDLSEFTLEGEELTDWKLTSVYAMNDKSLKPEWDAQVNIYAELIRLAGKHVSKAQIVAIGRDWSKRRAERESDYPQRQVICRPVYLWTSKQVQVYMERRIASHQKAQREGVWPDCSPEERWAKPEVWAVMKKGRKRAVKLHYDEASANKHLEQVDKNHSIQHRPGESVRCKSYCPVSRFCPQAKLLRPTLSDSLEQSIQVAQETKGDTQWHSKNMATETASS